LRKGNLHAIDHRIGKKRLEVRWVPKPVKRRWRRGVDQVVVNGARWKKVEGGGRIGRFVGGREVNIVVY